MLVREIRSKIACTVRLSMTEPSPLKTIVDGSTLMAGPCWVFQKTNSQAICPLLSFFRPDS
jgi:hypothetical protein